MFKTEIVEIFMTFVLKMLSALFKFKLWNGLILFYNVIYVTHRDILAKLKIRNNSYLLRSYMWFIHKICSTSRQQNTSRSSEGYFARLYKFDPISIVLRPVYSNWFMTTKLVDANGNLLSMHKPGLKPLHQIDDPLNPGNVRVFNL